MSVLKGKMIELLEQDLKQEYLDLCRQNYAEAVSITQELFPAYYKELPKMMNLSERHYNQVSEMKKRGDVEGEIRMLEIAIQEDTDLPGCYERLAVL